MDLFNDKKSSHPSVSELNEQFASLVKALKTLKDENESLRNQHSQLVAEKTSLLEKNEIARNRVESMISRLRAMESEAKES